MPLPLVVAIIAIIVSIKMLGLRVPFRRFPTALRKRYDHMLIEWDLPDRSQQRPVWDTALRLLCQRAAHDDPVPCIIWDKWVTDEPLANMTQLLAALDQCLPIILRREPSCSCGPHGSYEPKLIALDLFRRCLIPHNRLLGDLIYYGDRTTLEYLFYQLGSCGRVDTIANL